MEPFTLGWAAAALGGQFADNGNSTVTSVHTDSRQVVPGGLFFALVGENSNGHDYVAQAFERGAVAVVVSRIVPNLELDQPEIMVGDTIRALGDLANAYRCQFKIPIIAITGSVGKTSTREMTAAILRTKFNTHTSEKNYNNEIGLPLTLFGLTREHEAAVVEMGMRGRGEIDRLAEIAEPTIGLITRIGYAHIERLGSQEAVAQAKSELLARLPQDGIALLPYRDPFYNTLLGRVPEGVTTFTFGEGGAAVWPPDVRVYPLPHRPGSGAEATVMMHRKESFLALRAIGSHHLHNAAAALSVAFALDIPLGEAVAALEAWQGAEGRMTIRELANGITILDDCYNAGPESMEAALETLRQMTVLGGIAVLGDMKELGQWAEAAHRAVGRKVVDLGVRRLVTVGELAQVIADEAKSYAAETGKRTPELHHYADTDAASHAIRALVGPKDVVLVKGSRAMAMEQIVQAITGETNGGGHG